MAGAGAWIGVVGVRIIRDGGLWVAGVRGGVSQG